MSGTSRQPKSIGSVFSRRTAQRENNTKLNMRPEGFGINKGISHKNLAVQEWLRKGK